MQIYDTEAVESVKRYYHVLKACTGTSVQVGPRVDLCRTITGAKFTAKHKPQVKLDRFECHALKGIKGDFLDSQLSAAMFMVMRTPGHIPLPFPLNASDEQKEAVNQLKSVQAIGGLLGDTMGFGKTHETLLFLSWYIQHAPPPPASTGYRLHLLLVPSGPVCDQWVSTLSDAFPCINFIIAFGERPRDDRHINRFLSNTGLREAPDKLTH